MRWEIFSHLLSSPKTLLLLFCHKDSPLDHGKNGFLIDNNSKKSFEDLLENINNWDLESISKNAVSFVNKNFSLEKASDEEFLDYNSIIF